MKLAIRKEIINTLFLIHSSLLKPFHSLFEGNEVLLLGSL